MTQYFGAVDANGDPSGSATNNDGGFIFWRAYTCPGSGTKTPSLFQLMGHQALHSGSVGARLGLYNSGGTSLLWDSGQFTVNDNSGVDYWVGPASLSGIPDLTGGTDYTFCWCSENNLNGIASDHVDSTRSDGEYYNYASHALDYYTNGLPSSLPTPDSQYDMYPMRIAVPDDAPMQENAPEKVRLVTAGRWR